MTPYHDELFNALTHHLTTNTTPNLTYLWLLKYLLAHPDERPLEDLWDALKNDLPRLTATTH